MILVEAYTIRVVAGRDTVGGTWTSYYQVIEHTQYPDGNKNLSATLHPSSTAARAFGKIVPVDERYQADETVLSGGTRTPQEFAQLHLFQNIPGGYRK